MKKLLSNTTKKTYDGYGFVLPTICPHCGTVCDPIIKSIARNSYVYTAVVYANCCKNPFFTFHKPTERKHNINYSELISVYPEYISKNFSKHLSDVSPRFVDLYNQSYAAEQLGHMDLAGTGYRNALEALIKDFAINCLKQDPKQVSDTALAKSINKYYPIPEAQGLAHISRILGNDFTHYGKKYSEIEFQTFKQYVDGAIQIIDLYILSSIPLSPESTSSN